MYLSGNTGYRGSAEQLFRVFPLENTFTHPVRELSEYELARRCQREERSAQEALYARFARRMFAVCLRYARHRPEAEDLLQEGFVRVFDKLDGFRMEGSLEGWIRRIMVHTCINHLRKKSVRDEVLGTDHVRERSVAPVALSNLGQEELMGLVQELPAGYRAVFNLYAIEGFDHAEIAALMGFGESTSRSQLAKARQQLQRRLEELKVMEHHE
ncbi:MAG: RNA polymerase sigma factor [Flavobacteriales bacterium]